MRKKLLFTICFLYGLIAFAQDESAEYINHINKSLYELGESQTYPGSLIALQSGADTEDVNCLNLLGILYREGKGVGKNEDKAFELILKSAKKGYPPAQYNIGRFYMIGVGCDIDFDKAIHWLTLAADNGSEKAAYALGYMYFKGFGVPQDYKKAISWFELSPWSMAKHYLGICYYFGYGVEKNEDKAILYFTNSQTTNSNMFLNHIAENVRETVEASLSKEISEKETEKNTAVSKEAIDKTTEKTVDQLPSVKKALKPNYFNGKWKGKLIELDWSGTQIVRILPLSCEFTAEENTVHYKWELNTMITESTAILEDNALYFQNLNMVFNMPYTENPYSNILVWQLLSSQMGFKTVNKKTYLTGNLQTFTDEFKESGPPMHIILKQTEEGDKDDLTAAELIALADQKEHFITLYPNPFVDDVLIEYELDKDSNVNVGVYDLSGNTAAVTLEQGALQMQGKHKYTLKGSNLRAGMYIVRVGVDTEMHSRILIKN